MGRSGHDVLDRLIDEVAKGERDLSSIPNSDVRESVRIALRLHADAPSVPDAYTKARMRARVMARLARERAARDAAWRFLELLARPAPFIVRGVALGSLVLGIALAGFVASAETLPEDALYPVKIAAEQVRLALAATPSDRAAVEMSIAEHRLGEAERLVATGRTSDALVASAFYSQHVATAAAELGEDATSDLSVQLESRFAAQRERAASLAGPLSMNATTERASQVLVLIATSPLAPGRTHVERVADSAVALATDLAYAAAAAADRSEPVTVIAPTTTTRSPEDSRPSLDLPTTPDPRATQAAKQTREAAAIAKAAADKLKRTLDKANRNSHR